MITWLPIISLVLVSLTSIHCNSELVYVTPNAPPNPDCHDGLPCQTLKSYLNNKTFIQQSVNLTMVFLTGQHEGGGQQTVLKSTSFTVRGAGVLDVVIKNINIELQYATEICFENIILNHWNCTSPGPPFLVLEMVSVLAENQTHIFIRHAKNSSRNKIELVNSVFRNSSLSGRLSFIKSESNTEAMSLISSTLNIGKNTNVSFMYNLRYDSFTEAFNLYSDSYSQAPISPLLDHALTRKRLEQYQKQCYMFRCRLGYSSIILILSKHTYSVSHAQIHALVMHACNGEGSALKYIHC